MTVEKLFEESNLKPAYSRTQDKTSVLIFDSEDFNGHSVTVGILIESKNSKHFDVAFKAAVCSPEDTFDRELGIDIVAGRLARAKDADISIAGPSLDASLDSDIITHFFAKKLETLKEYLEYKDACDSLLKERRVNYNKKLSDKFEQFK